MVEKFKWLRQGIKDIPLCINNEEQYHILYTQGVLEGFLRTYKTKNTETSHSHFVFYYSIYFKINRTGRLRLVTYYKKATLKA